MLRDENKWSKIFFFFNRIAFRSLYSSTRTEKKNFTNRTRLIFQNLDEFRRKEIFFMLIKKKTNSRLSFFLS